MCIVEFTVEFTVKQTVETVVFMVEFIVKQTTVPSNETAEQGQLLQHKKCLKMVGQNL